MNENTYGQALAERLRALTSLDPESAERQDLATTGADIAAGFIPVLGTGQALRDMERARRAGSATDFALAATGLIPGGRAASSTVRAGMDALDRYKATRRLAETQSRLRHATDPAERKMLAEELQKQADILRRAKRK